MNDKRKARIETNFLTAGNHVTIHRIDAVGELAKFCISVWYVANKFLRALRMRKLKLFEGVSSADTIKVRNFVVFVINCWKINQRFDGYVVLEKLDAAGHVLVNLTK